MCQIFQVRCSLYKIESSSSVEEPEGLLLISKVVHTSGCHSRLVLGTSFYPTHLFIAFYIVRKFNLIFIFCVMYVHSGHCVIIIINNDYQQNARDFIHVEFFHNPTTIFLYEFLYQNIPSHRKKCILQFQVFRTYSLGCALTGSQSAMQRLYLC